MLILVLVLVVAAFGLLIATLVLAKTMLAWVSVGISAVAALLLIIDAIRRSRARSRARRPAPPVRHAEPEPDDEYDGDEYDEDYEDDLEQDYEDEPVGEPADEPDGEREHQHRLVGEHDYWGSLLGYTTPAGEPEEGAARHAAAQEEQQDPVAEDEPSVEPTPESDLAALAELTDEVLVVDERPRYHLSGCDWLGERATIPLPVHEARELGFSPCVVCAPDASLLARHRA